MEIRSHSKNGQLKLAVSAGARESKGFKLRSDEEASKIQEWCKSNLGAMISDNPPIQVGEFIRLQKPSGGDYLLVGGAVFAVASFPVCEMIHQSWPLKA